jgi:hypothetical protein
MKKKIEISMTLPIVDIKSLKRRYVLTIGEEVITSFSSWTIVIICCILSTSSVTAITLACTIWRNETDLLVVVLESF